MRAILIRHYKTLINVADEIMGWGDAPPAEDWEPDLAYVNQVLSSREAKFEMVHTSTLERSVRTGEYFAVNCGIAKVHPHPELKEVNYGALYKKSKKWVAQNVPEYKTDPDFVFPKGESFRQMQQRSSSCFSRLAKKHDGKTILVVAHAGVIRGLICHFLRLDYADNLRRKVSHRYIGEFRFTGGKFQQYGELGEASGFVNDGVIALPATHSSSKRPTFRPDRLLPAS